MAIGGRRPEHMISRLTPPFGRKAWWKFWYCTPWSNNSLENLIFHRLIDWFIVYFFMILLCSLIKPTTAPSASMPRVRMDGKSAMDRVYWGPVTTGLWKTVGRWIYVDGLVLQKLGLLYRFEITDRIRPPQWGRNVTALTHKGMLSPHVDGLLRRAYFWCKNSACCTASFRGQIL